MSYIKTVPIRLFLVCMVFQFTACTATYSETKNTDVDIPTLVELQDLYVNSQDCCESMGDFEYEGVNIGDSKKVIIGEGSDSFLFEGGKSYFKALELPSTSQPYFVKIESFSQHPPEDSSGGYVFNPVVMVLDENFNEVRKGEEHNFKPKKLSAEDAPLDVKAFRLGFKLVGTIPFEPNRDDGKYFIVLTTKDAMNFGTVLESTTLWGWGARDYKNLPHSPGGELVISLVTPGELNKENRKRWVREFEEVDVGNQYEGDWFTTLPPQAPNYRFKNLSGYAYDTYESHLVFSRYEGGGASTAFVKSYTIAPGGGWGNTLGAPQTQELVTEYALKYHSVNVDDFVYDLSSVSVDNVSCRRINFSGKSPYMFNLPIVGYDIICIHPDWIGNTNPLIVRIGANNVYTLGKKVDVLPNELANFYNNVRFKRAEK